MRKTLLTTVAAVAMCSVAGGTSLAAGPGPVDWTGIYFGGDVGGGAAWFKSTPHSGETADGVAKNDPSGFIGGGHVGYNWQMNTFVFGLEGDLMATGLSEHEQFSANSSRSIQTDVDLLGTLRGRLGMSFDQALLYVTGGIAFADASYLGISPGGTRNDGHFDSIGAVVGGGAEWRFSQDWSMRTELLYYIFDDKQEFGSETPGNHTTFEDAIVGRLGFSYHFSSDRRLKRDIVAISQLDNGLTLYKYRYLWSDEFYVGVIAQDVEKIVPDAVYLDADQYLRVDYSRLGLRFQTWTDWARSSKAELAIAA